MSNTNYTFLDGLIQGSQGPQGPQGPSGSGGGAASEILNDSSVAGANVAEALDGVVAGQGAGSFVFTVGKGPNCYPTIHDAIAAINALGTVGVSQRAEISILPGVYVSTTPYLVPAWVGVKGISKGTVQLYNTTTNLFQSQGWGNWYENFLIEGAPNPAVYAFDLNNQNGQHIRNVDMLNNGGVAQQKFVLQNGSTWRTLFIEHCIVDSFQPDGYDVYFGNTSGAARYCDVEINDVFFDNYHLTNYGGAFLMRGVQDVRLKDCKLRGAKTYNTSVRLEVGGVSGTPWIEIMSSILMDGIDGDLGGVPLFAEAGTTVYLWHSEAVGAVVAGTLQNHFSSV